MIYNKRKCLCPIGKIQLPPPLPPWPSKSSSFFNQPSTEKKPRERESSTWPTSPGSYIFPLSLLLLLSSLHSATTQPPSFCSGSFIYDLSFYVLPTPGFLPPHPPSLILSSDENIISLEFFFNLILFYFFFFFLSFEEEEEGGGARAALRNHFIFSSSKRTVRCTVPNDLILTHTVHVTDDGVYIKKMSRGKTKR